MANSVDRITRITKINKMNIKEEVLKLVSELKVKLSAETAPEAIVEVVELKEAVLTDGTLVKYDNLEVGSALTVVSVEGEIPAPDAVHEFEDGTMVTTVGGLITEVVEGMPVEPAPVEETDFDAKFAEFLKEFTQLKEQNKADKLELSKQLKGNTETILGVFTKVSEMITLASESPAAAAIAKPKGSVIANLREI